MHTGIKDEFRPSCKNCISKRNWFLSYGGKNGVKMAFLPGFCIFISFLMHFSQDGQELSLIPVCTFSGRSLEWFLRETAENQKTGKNAFFSPFLPPKLKNHFLISRFHKMVKIHPLYLCAQYQEDRWSAS